MSVWGISGHGGATYGSQLDISSMSDSMGEVGTRWKDTDTDIDRDTDIDIDRDTDSDTDTRPPVNPLERWSKKTPYDTCESMVRTSTLQEGIGTRQTN